MASEMQNEPHFGEGTPTNNTQRLSNVGYILAAIGAAAGALIPVFSPGSLEFRIAVGTSGVCAALAAAFGNAGSVSAKQSALRRVDQVATTTAEKVATVVGTVGAGEIIDAARKVLVRRRDQ